MVSKIGEESVVVSKAEVVTDYRARAWCRLPYPGHPEGCPNYGKKKFCPPQASLFEKIVKPPFTLVAVRFNLEKHAKRMKKKHPHWSDRQAKCILYWQRKVDKRLRRAVQRASSGFKDGLVLYKPEGNGVHVFETCRRAGLELKRNPQKIVWKVAVIGERRQ